MSYKIIFKSLDADPNNDSELQCFATIDKTIIIELDNGDNFCYQNVELDATTAIKLCKVLRTEISKIKE